LDNCLSIYFNEYKGFLIIQQRYRYRAEKYLEENMQDGVWAKASFPPKIPIRVRACASFATCPQHKARIGVIGVQGLVDSTSKPLHFTNDKVIELLFLLLL
jgi:hypothetical protein